MHPAQRSARVDAERPGLLPAVAAGMSVADAARGERERPAYRTEPEKMPQAGEAQPPGREDLAPGVVDHHDAVAHLQLGAPPARRGRRTLADRQKLHLGMACARLIERLHGELRERAAHVTEEGH